MSMIPMVSAHEDGVIYTPSAAVIGALVATIGSVVRLDLATQEVVSSAKMINGLGGGVGESVIRAVQYATMPLFLPDFKGLWQSIMANSLYTFRGQRWPQGRDGSIVWPWYDDFVTRGSNGEKGETVRGADLKSLAIEMRRKLVGRTKKGFAVISIDSIDRLGRKANETYMPLLSVWMFALMCYALSRRHNLYIISWIMVFIANLYAAMISRTYVLGAGNKTEHHCKDDCSKSLWIYKNQEKAMTILVLTVCENNLLDWSRHRSEPVVSVSKAGSVALANTIAIMGLIVAYLGVESYDTWENCIFYGIQAMGILRIGLKWLMANTNWNFQKEKFDDGAVVKGVFPRWGEAKEYAEEIAKASLEIKED